MMESDGRFETDGIVKGAQHSALLLILPLLIPLAIAFLWGDVTADAAYAHFQTARLIAKGQWQGISPLYPLVLVPAVWAGLSLPLIAAGLSVIGWSVAIAGWFAVGHAIDRRAFSLAMVVLLALHPLQGQVLGLETGVVLGSVALLVWAVVRTERPRVLHLVAPGLGLVFLAALYPPALAFVVPVIACWLIRRRSTRSLTPVALGAASYVLVAFLIEAWHTPQSIALLIAAGQALVAVGFAALTPRAERMFPASPERRTLGRAVVSAGLAALIVWQMVALAQDWRLRPIDRMALYRQAAAWLGQNTLPGETVATERPGLLGYLSDRSAVPLPNDASAKSLLTEIDRQRPDVCVALNTLAWQGVRAQPWFVERYEMVHEIATPYDAATPLAIFRYRPSPFDSGEYVSATVTFVGETGEQVELTGYHVQHWRLTPGEPLHVTLHWRAATPLSEPLSLLLQLRDPASDEVWAQVEDAAPGGLPTDLWNAGEEMVARYALQAPGDIPPGDYVAEVTLLRPNGGVLTVREEEASSHALATVTRPPVISDDPPSPDHVLDLTFGDSIALVGYDAPERVAPGDPLRLALYWHALADISRDYKVFVHLIGPDGSPLVQDDSVPVGWAYPTNSWQPGEFIRDEHVLQIDGSVPRGDYPLIVGLYDQERDERLVVFSSVGDLLGGRAFLREVQVR